ncbi:MAG: chemotaxis protein CheB [bacterium]
MSLKKTRKVKQSTVPVPAAADAATVSVGAAEGVCGFPVVGIGASAGGLSALELFFSGMPAGTVPGMAFVIVQHLAPDHKSILTDLIRRYTSMKVFEVEDGMVVKPNCAYIIPPNRDMAFLGGTLHLLEPAAARGQRLPIDFLFRSLAQDQHARAIGIVLSGTGSDGTLGVRAIKDEGGMVMAQTPASTEYDGMPRNAIATGLVDYELEPSAMPARLMAYVAHAFTKPVHHDMVVEPKVESALRRIFILLRSQTGHDFSQYKPSTIHRRIERRMAVQQIETMDGYVKYLQQNPAEVEAFFFDLLIGVTSFFRDPKAFKVLEEDVIPGLVAGKAESDVIRVWVPGCSTGEEAYSIAILFAELQEARKQSFRVQIFATDIDSRAIATARAGVYAAGIAADLSPERLARFFSAVPDSGIYRIHRAIRDMLVFSDQDVIRDPPFSRMDLISCRNVMIYMGIELQQKLIPLFHYALNPGGRLFLGSSETVGEFATLFDVLDRKAKVYQRRADSYGVQGAERGQSVPPSLSMAAVLPQKPAAECIPAKRPLREVAEQALLYGFDAAYALVNARGEILYLHGRAGMYLEPMPGEAGINSILKMAREGLRTDLAIALHKAVVTKTTVRQQGLSVKTNGHFTTINLRVCPVQSPPGASDAVPMFLVVMEEVPEQPKPPAAVETKLPDDGKENVKARIEALQQELRAKDEYIQTSNEELESANEELQSANEELQSTNEEMQSTNEELQSTNEEMQSTNEELETSKEEMQSINEELATVNTELQAKVLDLSRINNDMNNMMASTGIGTVFVDLQMRIMRFTPTVTAIINLIAADAGRPVAHIASNLSGYTRLVTDAQAVLDTLIPREVDVQTLEGKWYTMRIQPYRTVENVIEGVVITFVDITEKRLVSQALAKANDQLRQTMVVRDANDAVTVQDLDGRIIAWNPGAVRLYGWSEDEALVMNVCDRTPQDMRAGAMDTLRQLSCGELLAPYRTQRLARSGAVVAVSIISTALVDKAGHVYAIATVERAIS